MKPGDPVTVTNKDGEEVKGEIEALIEKTAGEYTEDWMDSGETLVDYWDGAIDPKEAVYSVTLGPFSPSYAHPETRIETREPEVRE